MQQLEEGKAVLEARVSSLAASLSQLVRVLALVVFICPRRPEQHLDLQEGVQLELNTGLREHSYAEQNIANHLCATDGIATALDEILISKKSKVDGILFAATIAKCKYDSMIWVEHQRASALQCALLESNQAASDTMKEFTQLSMFLQKQWEYNVHLESQVNCISITSFISELILIVLKLRFNNMQHRQIVL